MAAATTPRPRSISVAIVTLYVMLTAYCPTTNGYSVAATRNQNVIIGNAIVDGCYHNGTIFHDGSLVPTVEPCLQCKCRDHNLVCSLRICSDLPVPPPRGCVLVQKRGVCCAYVTCSKFHKLNEIAQRRGDGHTISRRRLPAVGGGVGNALFRGVEDDALAHQVEGNEKLCVVNGTIYKSGSAMTSSSLCSYCYCIAGRQKCVQPKCVLASPGCEPIYSDSTCCPIRYDCTKKLAATAAANGDTSSAKPNTVHHSNKHYLRTKMRTQRSRGCIIGPHFYPEGLKLPHDAANPCNICFCIRGTQKCTPKKCAPSIPNCEPIIPPGQCCPASYECDHSGDKVPNKSRQFDFFSMFFGDEFENSTMPSAEAEASSEGADPVSVAQHTSTKVPLSSSAPISSNASASDSIFAAIEAGLKYIESNDAKVGSILDKNANNVTRPRTTTVRPQPAIERVSTTTEKELSFLDILLGDDEDDDDAVPEVKNAESTSVRLPSSTESLLQDRVATDYVDETTVIITKYTTTDRPTDAEVEQEEESFSILYNSESTFEQDPTTLQYVDYTTDGSTIADNLESTSVGAQKTDQFHDTTNEVTPDAGTSSSTDSIAKNGAYEEDSSTKSSIAESTESSTVVSTTTEPTEAVVTVTIVPQSISTITPEKSPTNKSPLHQRIAATTIAPALVASNTPKTPTANVTVIKTTTENIFSAFIDGISSMFNEHNGTVSGLNKLYKIRVNTDRNATHRTPQSSTPKPTATAVPSTLHRIRNTTAPPPPKLRPTPIPLTGSSSSSSSTPAPLVFNPSILESELSYDYGEPTLPPSLPNLKIIPFLPTDAVKTNRNHLMNYNGYYNTQAEPAAPIPVKFDDTYSFPGESQPVLSIDQLSLSKESKVSLDSNEFELFHVGAQMSGEMAPDQLYHNHRHQEGAGKPHDQQEEYIRPSYPSITESIYDLNDPTRFDAETQKKLYPAYSKLGGSQYPFDVQAKTTAGSSLIAEHGGGSAGGYDIVTGYDKFVTAFPTKLGYGGSDTGSAMFGDDRTNQFSPPSETEGGFLPKETLEDPYLYDTYHNTKPILDLTTKHPLNVIRNEVPANTFQNSIQSESPLDTFSLTHTPDEPAEAIDHDYSSIVLPDIEDDDDDEGKHIISITTDSTYSSTSEYADEQHTVVDRQPNASSATADFRHQSLTSLFPSVSTSSPFPTTVQLSSRFPPSTPSPVGQQQTTQSDLFGSLFGFLFKDDEQLAEFQRYDETTTIPPFKKISTLVSLNDILNLTTNTVPSSSLKRTSESIPQRINDKLFDGVSTSTEFLNTFSVPSSIATTSPYTSSTSDAWSTSSTSSSTPSSTTSTSTESATHVDENDEDLPDLQILRDALLGSLSNSDPATLPIPSRHPIYQGSVPFLSPIFQATPEALESKHNHFGDTDHNPIRSDLDLILGDLPKDTPAAAGATLSTLPEYSSVPSRQDYVVHNGIVHNNGNPVVQSTVQSFEGAAQIFTKPAPSASSSTVGLLKLAGCNIYGRMYRVGRIISELSSECLECRCTEVGVNCTPLDC